jgi:hypothetical protein
LIFFLLCSHFFYRVLFFSDGIFKVSCRFHVRFQPPKAKPRKQKSITFPSLSFWSRE